MADIIIKVDKKASDTLLQQTKEKPPQLTLSMGVRKTVDGNLYVFEHEDIDIVVMPEKSKIVALAKEVMGDQVYGAQSRLFGFLSKKGVVQLDSIQGGNIYGSLEAIIPESRDVDPIQICLLSIDNFIKEEKPYFVSSNEYEEDLEDRFTDPDEEESTDFETAIATHAKEKGALKPALTFGLARYRLYRG